MNLSNFSNAYVRIHHSIRINIIIERSLFRIALQPKARTTVYTVDDFLTNCSLTCQANESVCVPCLTMRHRQKSHYCLTMDPNRGKWISTHSYGHRIARRVFLVFSDYGVR